MYNIEEKKSKKDIFVSMRNETKSVKWITERDTTHAYTLCFLCEEMISNLDCV